MRVLHILHTSTPDTSGYSIRSKYIIDLQGDLGIERAVVTSCRHPGDCATEELIDGVSYYRTAPPPPGMAARLPILRERALMDRLYRRAMEVAREFRPDLVHAHSPVLCGMPAAALARKLGVPFVYEIRDLWENASVDKGKFERGSLRYRLARWAETSVLRKADAVVTICRGLQNDIQSRGIPEEKIWLAPNGVDLARFERREPDPALAKQHKLNGCRIIGYIGSFFRYEGLDTLVSAMPAILARTPDARLLLVGSGDEGERLRKLTEELGIADRVIFTGRVPHQMVPSYNALCDLLVYPRIETETTRLTTPLKPLEAMAMGQAVVASDVAAMKELIEDGKDGLLFRSGSVQDLAARCTKLLHNDSLRKALGEHARRTVIETRDWRRIVQVYPAAYRQVLR